MCCHRWNCEQKFIAACGAVNALSVSFVDGGGNPGVPLPDDMGAQPGPEGLQQESKKATGVCWPGPAGTRRGGFANNVCQGLEASG